MFIAHRNFTLSERLCLSFSQNRQIQKIRINWLIFSILKYPFISNIRRYQQRIISLWKGKSFNMQSFCQFLSEVENLAILFPMPIIIWLQLVIKKSCYLRGGRKSYGHAFQKGVWYNEFGDRDWWKKKEYSNSWKKKFPICQHIEIQSKK